MSAPKKRKPRKPKRVVVWAIVDRRGVVNDSDIRSFFANSTAANWNNGHLAGSPYHVVRCEGVLK